MYNLRIFQVLIGGTLISESPSGVQIWFLTYYFGRKDLSLRLILPFLSLYPLLHRSGSRCYGSVSSWVCLFQLRMQNWGNNHRRVLRYTRPMLRWSWAKAPVINHPLSKSFLTLRKQWHSGSSGVYVISESVSICYWKVWVVPFLNT